MQIEIRSGLGESLLLGLILFALGYLLLGPLVVLVLEGVGMIP